MKFYKLRKISVSLVITFVPLYLFTVFAPAVFASSGKMWYENYALEGGTKLTRDYTFGLNENFDASPPNDLKKRFEFFKNELPDEIPLYAPYQPDEIAGSKIKIYVSNDGDDAGGNGTIENPYKTLQKAVDVAENGKNKSGGITIYMRGGTYTAKDGINMGVGLSGTKENPTFISAYNGEEVTLTTADSINGSDFKPVDDPVGLKKIPKSAADKIMTVNLKGLGINSVAEMSENSRPTLYVDGTECVISRWPNTENVGMLKYEEGPYAKYGVVDVGPIEWEVFEFPELKYTGGTEERGFEFCVASNRPFRWENTGNIWMYGYWNYEWVNNHRRVKSFNPDIMSVRTTKGAGNPAKYIANKKTFYFYNVLEELDSPGEWFYDYDTGILYLYPPYDISNSKIYLSGASSNIITANNIKHTVFNGIRFETSLKTALKVSNGHYNLIQNCSFSNITERENVYISGSHNGIISSYSDGLLHFSTQRADWTVKTTEYTRNFVQNCVFTNSSPGTDGEVVLMSFGRGDIISHNFCAGTNAGVAYEMSQDSIHEYNEIVAVPNVAEDAGQIYLTSGLLQKGGVVRYNYLNRSTPEIRPAPSGIYLDECGSGFLVYGNIIREGDIYAHGGNDHSIVNNIIINNYSQTPSIYVNDNFYYTGPYWNINVLQTNQQYLESASFFRPHLMNRYPYMYNQIVGNMKGKALIDSPDYNIKNDKINEYQSSPTGHYFANNLMVDCRIGLGNPSPFHTIKDSLRTGNHMVSSDEIKFQNYKAGYFDISQEELSKINPEMWELPKQSKMGMILDEKLYTKKTELGKSKLISPAVSENTIIYENEVHFKWSAAYARSTSRIEVATDEKFENIIFSKTTPLLQATFTEAEENQTYFWRVISENWSNSISDKELSSDVGKFRIASGAEIAANADVETFDLKIIVDEYSKRLASIEAEYNKEREEENSDRVYTDGLIDKLKPVFDEAERKINDKSIKSNAELKNYILEFTHKFCYIWAQNTKAETVNLSDGDFLNPENWYNQNPDKTKLVKEGNTLVIVNDEKGKTTQTVLKNRIITRPKQTLKFKMKFDKIESWTCVDMMHFSNSTQERSYFVVLKPDLIELQRNPLDAGWKDGIIDLFENNKEVVKDNTWFEYEYSSDFTEDGLKITVKIDGKEYFNFTDKTNFRFDLGYFGIMHNGSNLKTYIAECE